ncbi:MAG TPA: aminotransferase class V-fold PLP-dependent enzyme [Sphingobacteriaceae bacterium]
MISFYPGPSKVHNEIPKYVKDACRKGILSINHRSPEFMKIYERTVKLLREKLDVPSDYKVFFTSSATECWEIIAQSLVSKRSYHIFNGAFGQKWFEYSNKIKSGARQFPFDREELPNANKYKFGSTDGVICITHNETSNGTQVPEEFIRDLKENNPGHLVAVDATSSMAGVALTFELADIWFASVQKCFGLPAGLAVMICSPRAMEKAEEINDRAFYNSLLFMNDMLEKWQTSFTPNVMNIYLLMRVLEKSDPIALVDAKIKKRYRKWVKFFEGQHMLRHFIKNQAAHSYTVLPIIAPEGAIIKLKKDAKEKGFLLGEGYGDLKATTFRIANFPALKKKEIDKLKDFLAVY